MRAGGGVNHRGNLSDCILVKDNHLAGIAIAEAVAKARRPVAGPHRPGRVRHPRPGRARPLAAGADLVLLDNMTPDQVADCVPCCGPPATRCLVEVSRRRHPRQRRRLRRRRRRPHLRRRPHPLRPRRSTSASTSAEPGHRCAARHRRRQHPDRRRPVRRRRAGRPLAHRHQRRAHLRRARPAGHPVPVQHGVGVRPTSPGWSSPPPSPGSPPSCGRWPALPRVRAGGARARHPHRHADPLREPQGGRPRPHRQRGRRLRPLRRARRSWSTSAPPPPSTPSRPRASTSAAPSSPASRSASTPSSPGPRPCRWVELVAPRASSARPRRVDPVGRALRVRGRGRRPVPALRGRAGAVHGGVHRRPGRADRPAVRRPSSTTSRG